jgi:hypothetical protein
MLCFYVPCACIYVHVLVYIEIGILCEWRGEDREFCEHASNCKNCAFVVINFDLLNSNINKDEDHLKKLGI